MTSSDEGQDSELQQRYRQASDADPRAPSAAVREAILEEGRRVAASAAAPPVAIAPPRRRTSRWKMTAWGTAAAALLAALVIAPRLWDQAPTQVAAISAPKVPFNQAARKTEPDELASQPAAAVPVMPVTGPRMESLAPRLTDVPTLHPSAAPPPVHIPEQSVEVTSVNRNNQSAAMQSRAQATRVNPSYNASSDYARQSTKASTPLLAAAASAGDLGRTSQLLDQGAGVNDYDASGNTPLMLAIGQDRVDTVRLLLDRGADPNVADQRGLTPLQLAQQSKLDDIAALLVKAGAH